MNLLMISQPEQSRFVDRGVLLLYFARTAIAVCPKCGGPAFVNGQSKSTGHFRAEDGRVTCSKCSFNLKYGKWFGPITRSVKDRCQNCGHKWLKYLEHLDSLDNGKKEISITCPSCGEMPRYAGLRTREQFSGAPNDPVFGLPLWLQEPCCGEILWAYNAEHLSRLRQYVAASLRERVTARLAMAWSMFARLPQWMTSAKNRKAVLSGFDRLERRLEMVPGTPQLRDQPAPIPSQ
ncbi:MAG TPA: hypothetical protein VHZ52_12505 [Acidobacteriaceae bacterium]|nr:hypothetical protein [Acidobacteriaceae bacterium]